MDPSWHCKPLTTNKKPGAFEQQTFLVVPSHSPPVLAGIAPLGPPKPWIDIDIDGCQSHGSQGTVYLGWLPPSVISMDDNPNN